MTTPASLTRYLRRHRPTFPPIQSATRHGGASSANLDRRPGNFPSPRSWKDAASPTQRGSVAAETIDAGTRVVLRVSPSVPCDHESSSNRRREHACVLPSSIHSSGGWIRTNDHPINSRTLCQLSYAGSSSTSGAEYRPIRCCGLRISHLGQCSGMRSRGRDPRNSHECGLLHSRVRNYRGDARCGISALSSWQGLPSASSLAAGPAASRMTRWSPAPASPCRAPPAQRVSQAATDKATALRKSVASKATDLSKSTASQLSKAVGSGARKARDAARDKAWSPARGRVGKTHAPKVDAPSMNGNSHTAHDYHD